MTTLKYTPVKEIPLVHASLRKTFNTGLTRSVEFRKEQLKAFYRLIDENTEAILKAVYDDLKKPRGEAILSEIGAIKEEATFLLKNIDKLSMPQKVKPYLTVNAMDTTLIRKEPLGVVLVIGSWNYPFNLLLTPVVGAISAGNCVVIKPSEGAPHAAALIAELIPKYLDPRAYSVVNGAVEETTELLKSRWDHIFYTGSGTVGRIIATAAAKQLTPVTLELGGKSPAVITEDADLTLTAHRIAFGKYFNAGQTCIAPDYVLINEDKVKPFVEAMRATIKEFYGEDPQKSDSYPRIIAPRHFGRLQNLIESRSSGSVVIGGQMDMDDLYIAPTVIIDLKEDEKLMQEEIFGPILPVIGVKDVDEAIEFINSRDQPLALYTFSKNKETINKILDNTRSGGAVVNDTLMHFAEPSLPFGGVGPSGQGSYHGAKSFETFSHSRSTMIKEQNMEAVNILRYPPYSNEKSEVLGFFLTSGSSIFQLPRVISLATKIIFGSGATPATTKSASAEATSVTRRRRRHVLYYRRKSKIKKTSQDNIYLPVNNNAQSHLLPPYPPSKPHSCPSPWSSSPLPSRDKFLADTIHLPPLSPPSLPVSSFIFDQRTRQCMRLYIDPSEFLSLNQN
ncbi:fatty aldehyde dehydrogenase [Endogone sp. FLAS-F59071]|nr:fatty aldehyde dehydrogenase [Endogone sp. FLAS-F59071]|eukprot:RUS21091.1 fatty aldehyde dehydrogenase [Endogone sp. FLAS-F59071]